ncbi:MAG TPA: hypothetical protein VFJ17_13950 [Mycobacteriales bacterium]|nr:hypothetical protein [Mycobacteriales bacterium]
MSEQPTEFSQLTAAGEVRATSMDLLLAVTQLVERRRPSVEDLIAAVTLPWSSDIATA